MKLSLNKTDYSWPYRKEDPLAAHGRPRPGRSVWVRPLAGSGRAIGWREVINGPRRRVPEWPGRWSRPQPDPWPGQVVR